MSRFGLDLETGTTYYSFAPSMHPLAILLTQSFSAEFDNLPTADQRRAVDDLEKLIAELREGKIAELDSMGFGIASAAQPDYYLAGCLDFAIWRMCEYLRVSRATSRPSCLQLYSQYSTPTRISEAAPYLKEVIAKFDLEHVGRG
jgi:hypothetical protein